MRLTIDLDNPTNLDIQKCYYNLQYITKLKPQIRLSASGNGVHIKVHGLKISKEDLEILRETLRDDKIRIKYDRERVAKPKQVLWTVKNGKKASDWTYDIDSIISSIGKLRSNKK